MFIVIVNYGVANDELRFFDLEPRLRLFRGAKYNLRSCGMQAAIPYDFFYGPSLLDRGVIFACLPDFYFFKRVDFKAIAFRFLKCIFKRGSDHAKTYCSRIAGAA